MSDDDYVFQSREGENKAITRQMVNHILDDACETVGVTCDAEDLCLLGMEKWLFACPLDGHFKSFVKVYGKKVSWHHPGEP